MSKVFIEDENKNILANANEDPFIIDQVGTDVFVNGQRQDRLDFTSDPQEQLDAKQDKLSQAQLQAIGEVDAVKSIALQNQTDIVELDKQVTDKTDLTTLASKVENNTTEINKKLKGSNKYTTNQETISLKGGKIYFIIIPNGTTAVFNRGVSETHSTPLRTISITVSINDTYAALLSLTANDKIEAFSMTASGLKVNLPQGSFIYGIGDIL